MKKRGRSKIRPRYFIKDNLPTKSRASKMLLFSIYVKLTSKNKKSYPKVAQFVNIITSILQEDQAYQARFEA